MPLDFLGAIDTRLLEKMFTFGVQSVAEAA
jgi:hypothetical protein